MYVNFLSKSRTTELVPTLADTQALLAFSINKNNSGFCVFSNSFFVYFSPLSQTLPGKEAKYTVLTSSSLQHVLLQFSDISTNIFTSKFSGSSVTSLPVSKMFRFVRTSSSTVIGKILKFKSIWWFLTLLSCTKIFKKLCHFFQINLNKFPSNIFPVFEFIFTTKAC